MDEILKKYNDARVAYEAQDRKVRDLREQLQREESLLNEHQRGLSSAKALVDLHLNQPANTGAAAAEPYAGVHPHVPSTPPRTAEEQAFDAREAKRSEQIRGIAEKSYEHANRDVVGVGNKPADAKLEDRAVGTIKAEEKPVEKKGHSK